MICPFLCVLKYTLASSTPPYARFSGPVAVEKDRSAGRGLLHDDDGAGCSPGHHPGGEHPSWQGLGRGHHQGWRSAKCLHPGPPHGPAEVRRASWMVVVVSL